MGDSKSIPMGQDVIVMKTQLGVMEFLLMEPPSSCDLATAYHVNV